MPRADPSRQSLYGSVTRRHLAKFALTQAQLLKIAMGHGRSFFQCSREVSSNYTFELGDRRVLILVSVACTSSAASLELVFLEDEGCTGRAVHCRIVAI